MCYMEILSLDLFLSFFLLVEIAAMLDITTTFTAFIFVAFALTTFLK